MFETERIRAVRAPQLKPSRSRSELQYGDPVAYPPNEDISDFVLDYAKQLAVGALVE